MPALRRREVYDYKGSKVSVTSMLAGNPISRTNRYSSGGIMKSHSRIVAILSLLLAGFVGCQAADAAMPVPNPQFDASLAKTKGEQTAVVSGGCFWGIQAVFAHVKGVIKATSGYAGGSAKNPSYEEVSTGDTGHAESVEIIYDPS